MSDTPRTDTESFYPHDSKHKVCDANFARTLERELNATNDRVKRLEESSQQLKSLNNKICEINLKVSQERDDLNVRIKRLDEWKESALEVEREWDANAVATMLGAKLGESQRKVIQREVPLLLERIKRLEEALDLVRPYCSFVHHSKKHQHAYNEPCPVVALIEKTKKAKP